MSEFMPFYQRDTCCQVGIGLFCNFRACICFIDWDLRFFLILNLFPFPLSWSFVLTEHHDLFDLFIIIISTYLYFLQLATPTSCHLCFSVQFRSLPFATAIQTQPSLHRNPPILFPYRTQTQKTPNSHHSIHPPPLYPPQHNPLNISYTRKPNIHTLYNPPALFLPPCAAPLSPFSHPFLYFTRSHTALHVQTENNPPPLLDIPTILLLTQSHFLHSQSSTEKQKLRHPGFPCGPPPWY